jgi:hypothetical protein
MTHDPIRLLHDSSVGNALRRDLGAAARADAGYDVAAGLARFEADLARGTGASQLAGGAGGAVTAGALLLAGGLTAALIWLSPAIDRPAPASHVAVAARPVVEPAPIVAAPVAPIVAAPLAVEAADEPADEPEAPAVVAAAGPPAPAAQPARRVRSAKHEVAAAPDHLREARSLQAARSQLGRDAAKALALAEAGALEFRGGTFAQEWEGVAILALFELRRGDARARGEAYLARWPSGTYAPRIRQALAATP